MKAKENQRKAREKEKKGKGGEAPTRTPAQPKTPHVA